MGCPLSKVDFCLAIESIRKYWDAMRQIEDALGISFCEGPMVDIMDAYVNTLASTMRDVLPDNANYDDVPWTSYFCWEKDFGRGYHEGDVSIDGKEFPIDTPEGLYDLLIKLYWEEKEN